jgi:hypothetical protein
MFRIPVTTAARTITVLVIAIAVMAVGYLMAGSTVSRAGAPEVVASVSAPPSSTADDNTPWG